MMSQPHKIAQAMLETSLGVATETELLMQDYFTLPLFASKTCSKCGETKSLSDFYMIRSGRRAGRYHVQCRACQSERDAQYRAKNAERVKATDRQYYARNKEIAKEKGREWKHRNKEKARRISTNHAAAYPDRRLARGAVNDAVRRGHFPPAWSMVCECCQEAQAAHWHHHNGYGKAHQLDVIAVCTACHAQAHKRIYKAPEPVDQQSRRVKLTQEQVNEIRARAQAGEQLNHIAGSYGVARNTVGDIVNFRTWRDDE